MAFLSYSHQDSAIADWLHESLEEFRVPPQLIGRLTDQGPVPKKLAPIFRDRQELAAAADLNEEIEEAIGASRFLIILCSPAAAKSRWIDEEISSFKRLHREDRILAAIVDGEPFASDIPGREHEECFPAALRFHFDSRGRPTKQRAEPIAADLREHGDGRKMGMLKLAAGMLGVGLDDLAQREAQRRHRRLYLITAASVAGMLFTSGLAYTAIDARDDARDQRTRGGGVDRASCSATSGKSLSPSAGSTCSMRSERGRWPIIERQDKQGLTDEALAQRSKALTLMGEIAADRGDLDGALRRYREALAGTAEALRRFPNDPQRMFDHAQSVYYVGSIAMRRGRIAEASTQFREYSRLAGRMIAADPDNPKWRLEGVYSASNLGRVELDQARYPEAARTFQASVRAMDLLIAAEPANAEYLELLLEALGYHADALDRAGELDLSIRERERQLALLAPYLVLDRPDAGLRQKAMIANMHLSLLRFARGATVPALDQAAKAVDIGNGLVALEPSNADWVGRSANTQLSQATLLLRSGRIAEAKAAAELGCGKTTQLIARDPTVAYWQDNARRCLGLRAELASLAGSPSEALYLALQVLDRVRSGNIDSAMDRFALSQAHKLVGDILWRSGDGAGAKSAWQAGLAAWPKGITETPRQMAERGEMLRGIGQRAEGMRIASQLAAMGYRKSITNRARV